MKALFGGNTGDKEVGKKNNVTLNSHKDGPKLLNKNIVQNLASNSIMKKLSLTSNRLTQLPAELFNSCAFQNTLVELKLDDNLLKELPSSFSLLQSLERLSISRNGFKKLPVEICQLFHLDYLNISENKLEELPIEISLMQNLKIFDFRKNLVNRFPFEISKCGAIREILFEGNPIDPKQADLLLNGMREFMNALASQLKDRDKVSKTDSESGQSGSNQQQQQTKDKRKQLLELLRDEQGRTYFTKFLETEHNEENIHFFDSVSKFSYASSITTNRDLIVKEAWRIFNTFLDDTDSNNNNNNNNNNSGTKNMKVNVPASVLDPLKMLFVQAKQDPNVLNGQIFGKAKKVIVTLMANDCLVRFIRSKEYKDYIETRPDDVWAKRNKSLGLN